MLSKPVPRKEDHRFITGRGLYVEDLQLPGMLHLAFVRSSHAHALVRRIDRERALAVPGVIAVVAGAEWPELAAVLPELNGSFSLTNPYCDHIRVPPHHLFPKKACYVGEQIAAVVAETPYAAADGADAVDIEYGALPAAANLEAATKPGAPRVHEGYDNIVAHLRHEVGDVEAGFRDAPVVIEERLETQSLKSMAIECRACAAQWDPATQTLNVWSTCQFPYMLRGSLARILGFAEDNVRVIARDIGGGFGLKGVLYAEDIIVPLIAYRLQRPVRWGESRMEHMTASNHSGAQITDVRLAARADGTILAMDVRMQKDVGAYDHFEMMLQINTVNHMTTHYKVPNLRVEGWAVATNTSPGSPFRGAGRVEAVFIMDRMLDAVARKTGIDPLEVRMRNIVAPADLPYRNGLIYRDGVPITYGDADFPLLLHIAAERADYAGWRQRQRELRRQGRSIGIGISSYVEAGGIGPCEGATVKVDDAGRVQVLVGVNSQGQSHETTLAQVCAHSLGARYEDVHVLGGDTRLQNFGFGTGASRVAINAGNAVAKAASGVRRKISVLASRILGCSEDEIRVEDGIVCVAGARQNFITLADLAGRAVRDPGMAALGGPGLVATEFFYPRTVSWSSGVNIAVVEVDRESGAIRVLKYVFVHDSGIPLNPLVVEGQLSGGFAQGLGIAFGEQAVYDDEGQVLSGSIMDYFVPRAADVPDIEIEHVVIPTTDNLLGIKSVGESGPNSPPAALAAAVEDALEHAVRITRLPITIGTVLDAVGMPEQSPE